MIWSVVIEMSPRPIRRCAIWRPRVGSRLLLRTTPWFGALRAGAALRRSGLRGVYEMGGVGMQCRHALVQRRDP